MYLQPTGSISNNVDRENIALRYIALDHDEQEPRPIQLDWFLFTICSLPGEKWRWPTGPYNDHTTSWCNRLKPMSAVVVQVAAGDDHSMALMKKCG